jgi:hypothetical protein
VQDRYEFSRFRALHSLIDAPRCDSHGANQEASGLCIVRYVSVQYFSRFAPTMITNQDGPIEPCSINDASNLSMRFSHYFPEIT